VGIAAELGAGLICGPTPEEHPMANNADEHMDSALEAAGLAPGDRFADDVARSLAGQPDPQPQSFQPLPRRRRPVRRMARALGGAFAGVFWGFLYGVQVLWERRVDVALVLCVTAWVGYWATAWLFLIIDRMGY
jgi:hypothetical protein